LEEPCAQTLSGKTQITYHGNQITDRISQTNIFIVEDAWNSFEKNWEKATVFQNTMLSKDSHLRRRLEQF
jgi:hypothetical protein